mmetsp:Transcript_24815/g.57242  ORF Transcript_24815/g.57242 Transcript_24815/m.57242 type:complete len:243 (+) Transcript_24815:4445-5173(+)
MSMTPISRALSTARRPTELSINAFAPSGGVASRTLTTSRPALTAKCSAVSPPLEGASMSSGNCDRYRTVSRWTAITAQCSAVKPSTLTSLGFAAPVSIIARSRSVKPSVAAICKVARPLTSSGDALAPASTSAMATLVLRATVAIESAVCCLRLSTLSGTWPSMSCVTTLKWLACAATCSALFPSSSTNDPLAPARSMRVTPSESPSSANACSSSSRCCACRSRMALATMLISAWSAMSAAS